MRNAILTICVTVVVIGVCPAGAEEKVSVTPAESATAPAIAVERIPQRKPLVQIAVLLDTSGSMSGLIDQARAELWAIVNEFIFAKRGGVEPEVQVALYEYGKSTLAVTDGYIRQIVPFTTDLDKISEELFALQTNGGDEYCGWVIKDATARLKWSESPDDLKVIFIAGNEPFTQGPVDYKESCKTAITKNIVVNTIHCGSEGEGLNGKWKDGAVLADGKYLNIDQNRQIVHIAAPQDKDITELSVKLNDTYIAYGSYGSAASQRQEAQDSSAAGLSKEAAVQRSVAKASMNYRNDHWDLVDAVQNEKVELSQVKAEDLPENMRKMSVEEKKAYVQSKQKERADIQAKVQQLNEQRKRYVAAEMTKQQKEGQTLGSAVIQAVREQAQKKDFKFESFRESSNSAVEKGD